MGGRIEFREKLSGILKMAEENGCQITIDEVECYFEEEHLSKEQIELVFDYLLAQKIVVKGYEKTGGSVTSSEENKAAFTEEEQRYLKEYMKDIGGIREADEEEREALFEKVLEGDALAKSRLVEIYLPEVVEIAKQLYHPEVFLGDLVQEGNVGLILGVDMIDDLDKAHDVIRREIRQAIQMLIEEQTELKNRDKKMVEKVNTLDESIQALTEELGRKVTIEELAVYMGMSEEEVEDILRLTGEETQEEEAQQ